MLKSLVINSLLLLFFLTSSQAMGQSTYYVSAVGNDQNDGRSIINAFKSIERINNLSLQAGDSVLFRRGDTFRGTLLVRQSGSQEHPIVLATFGTGAKPILAGSQPLTGWTNLGGNIWQSSCQSCGSQVTGVYQDEVSLPLGRYPNADTPNKGYLTIRAHTQKYQIFSQEPLPTNIDWKGGEVVMRPTQWIIDRAIVDQQYGDALNLFNYSNYEPGDGWGFFFQSHPATLDQNGEWYYNQNDKTVRLYLAQGDPNALSIAATVNSRGVELNSVSNIKFLNLHLTQSLNTSFYANNVSNITLTGLDIIDSGEDGIIFSGGGSNIFIENCRIIDVNNNGVSIAPYQNVTFRGNTLRHVGIVPGRGKSGDGQYNGLQSSANQNVLIENNIIDSVGYNGLTFWNNTTIQQNVISNYCMAKSDGGAIYAWNGPKNSMLNIKILSNIIYNGLGAPEGSLMGGYSGANGIFLDDCIENVEIRNNTVFNNHQWGIYLHATTNTIVINNTSFNNRVAQLSMYNNAGRCLFRGNIVKQNILFSKLADQFTGQYESHADDLPLYGIIDSNYYARPFDQTALIRGIKNYGIGSNFSLPDWTAFSTQDAHSTVSPITYQPYQSNGFGGTTRLNDTFDTNGTGWYTFSAFNNAETSWDNTNKLDGGSLRIGFTTPSNRGHESFMLAYKNFGAVTKGKTYLLRFDAIASAPQEVYVYIRKSDFGKEFDKRYTLTFDPVRKSYELPYTSSDTEGSTIVIFEMFEDGPSFWIDNVRLLEDAVARNNPDDYIKFAYNPTAKDSLIIINGFYRDVKNQTYNNQFILKPFSSVVLMKSEPVRSAIDLSLTLEVDKRTVKIDDAATFQIKIRNNSDTTAGLTRWNCRLPANLQFINSNGQVLNDNVLSGDIQQIPPYSQATAVIRVKATAGGSYQTAVQIISTTSPDPDSTPNSGTGDGEDDASIIDLRVLGNDEFVYTSPNPNQRTLPAVASNQPAADPNKADLSLRMALSKRTVVLGETITCTLYVSNAGGAAAGSATVQYELPNGLEVVDAAGWSVGGRSLTTTLNNIAAGSTTSVSFQARAVTSGDWTTKAQVSASSVPDPDSTPGNGFDNGEDDQTQVSVRVK
jgi:uncharacterized repeat protein (TIGR01451 family)